MRGDSIRADEVGGTNWAAAIAALKEGQYVLHKQVGMTLLDYDHRGPDRQLGPLRLRMQSNWLLENVTRERAEADLEFMEAVLRQLKEDSPEVRELADQRSVIFELLDDYGMGATLVAVRTNGGTVWKWPKLRDEPHND